MRTTTLRLASLRGAGLLFGAAALLCGAGAVRAQQRAVVDAQGAAAIPDDPQALLRELSSVTAELERLEREAQQLSAEGEGVAPQRAALRERAKRQARLLYHLAQGEALALRGGPEALLSHLALRQHARRALGATLRELDGARVRATGLQGARATNDAALASARTRREALEAARHRAEALGTLRANTLGVTAGIVADPLSASQTVYGGGVSATAPVENSFEEATGRLLFPVAGRAEVRRAQRQGADGPGLEVVAPAGAPVRAVFAGRVAFADHYGPYGRIVILDHGDHYYTVSANLASIAVRVGDEVNAGSVVGTVGDDGRGPMLYFEVRRGSDTIDPVPWLGL